MHPEVMNFCRQVVETYSGPMKRVLDVGAFDMNGSTRVLFRNVVYVGVDIHAGPGVDWVGKAHEYASEGWDGALFDVLVSTQALEHDPFWRETLTSCCQLVRPGGLILLTCASGNSNPHARHLWPSGYYGNRIPSDFLPVLARVAVKATARVERSGLDLQVRGVRQGALECLDATGHEYDLHIDEGPEGPTRVLTVDLDIDGKAPIVAKGPTVDVAAYQALRLLGAARALGRV